MAIIGTFSEIAKYFQHSPKFLDAFEYLKAALNSKTEAAKRIQSYQMGTFERVDVHSDFYAIEQKYQSKNRSDCFLESHLKNIDIQLGIFGNELIEHAHVEKLTLDQDHSLERDLFMYQDFKDTNKILLGPKVFAVFFPEDGHMGGQMYHQSEVCTKTVVKMPVEFYKG